MISGCFKVYSKDVKSCNQFFQDVCGSLATVQLKFNTDKFFKNFSQPGYKVLQLFFSLFWVWEILKSAVKDTDDVFYLLSVRFCFLLRSIPVGMCKSQSMLSLERLHTLSIDVQDKCKGTKIVAFLGSPIKSVRVRVCYH